jgi:uncharacterized protein YciI
MAQFVMTCLDHPGALERRMGARADHLDYVARRRDMVRLAGPLLTDDGQMAGSLFILEAPDRASVEAFAAGDPYRLADVFASTEIRPFRVTVGELP